MRSHGAARRVAATTIVAGAGLAIALPAIGATVGGNVDAGGLGSSDHSELQAFYPGTITINAGESVKFSINGFHPIAFVPDGRALPQLIVPTGRNAPAANDPAGNPYWWGAVGVPEFGFNGAIVAPSKSLVVTGRRVVVSGFPQGRRPTATFTFPRPGVYRYRCITHPEMRGTVRVLPRSARIATAAQVARAKAERARDLAAERRARRAAERRTGGTTVLVGLGTKRWHAFAFYPSRLTVQVGTTVTFRWAGRSEVHSVTFGPAAQQQRLIQAFETAQQVLPGEVQYPSDPPGAPPVVTSTAHGVGLVHSGLLFDPGAGPPGQPNAFQATFTEAGTFSYVCVVHGSLMKGTITVVP